MIDEFDNFYEEKKLFLEDSEEQLGNMESTLMDIMDIPVDDIHQDMINTIFRSMHTIKGNAGMFGYDNIVSFTHIAESLLEEIRTHKIKLNSDIIDMLLVINDHTKILINKSINEKDLNSDEENQNKALKKEMKSYLGISEEFDNIITEKEEEEENNNTLLRYRIEIKLKYDFLRSGMDLISIINYLDAIGTIESVLVIDKDIPELDKLNPLDGYMKFDILYETNEPKIEIIEAFEFVQEDIELVISIYDKSKSLEKTDVKGYNTTIDTKPEVIEQNQKITIVQNTKKDKPKNNERLKESVDIDIDIDIDTNINNNFSLRVDSTKIDKLMKQIGEMVIANAKISQKTQNSDDSDLEEAVETMSAMLEEIRDGVMNIRMVQVGDSLSKLRRIARDTAKKIGKTINFQIDGGETELDKTVIEKITDPLVHMLRNSIDHGIEMPETRVKNGKNAEGNITLKAYAHTGSIIIEIQDDGAGIDKNTILKKAIENGIIQTHENLTDKDIYALIFEPGFSTAKSVSDLSGRGVGMDVVKKNIDDLRGIVDIISEVGVGTTMKIRLPLTLAIIDGFLIKVGATKYIIPLDMIQECIELTSTKKERLKEDGYIILRSDILPILDIREYFQEEEILNIRENIVVVKYGESQIGLLVDQLYGEFQTVIKPLGDLFENTNGIMGGTILGSGDIALIFDIPKLIDEKIENYKKGNRQDGN